VCVCARARVRVSVFVCVCVYAGGGRGGAGGGGGGGVCVCGGVCREGGGGGGGTVLLTSWAYCASSPWPTTYVRYQNVDVFLSYTSIQKMLTPYLLLPQYASALTLS